LKQGDTMKTAIVTGASRGFGYELAASLARLGWNLVIDARDGSALKTAAAELDGLGPGRVVFVVGDVSDRLHARHLVDSAAGLGDLKLLVNNASILGPSPQPNLAEYSIDVLEEVFRVNVLGPVSLTQLALPYLRSTGGIVVNITSDAAVEPYEGWGGYGSSKAALEQVSNILAAEEPDVAVYWFDPGDMRTQMHQEAFPGEDISDRPLPGTRVPALIDLLEMGLPSGRYTAEALLAEKVSA
jgi:NAD(P)-dependent dehydrogenase (short-subunit alcohol dehydrogenase family)